MKKVFLLLLSLVTLSFTSCGDDDKVTPDNVNEQEVITKLVYTLTSTTDASDKVVFTVEAKDGGELSSHDHDHDNETDAVSKSLSDGDGHDHDHEDGGEEEEEVLLKQEGVLKDNTVYNGVIQLFNTKEDVIAEEISNELEEHQFFFEASTGINITYMDKDANDNPIGIETKITTSVVTKGSHIDVVLLHGPDKGAVGVKEGNSKNAGGETDIEVEIYPINGLPAIAPVEENHEIAKVVYTLTNTSDATDKVTFEIEVDEEHDHDHEEKEGEEHDDELEVVQTGVLKNNATYNAVIAILDEEGHDIVEEDIKKELDHHQFFYEIEGSGISIAYADKDEDDNPVGIETTFTTATVDSDVEIHIILLHEPNKLAVGVKEGDITNAAGETDLEVEIHNIDVEATKVLAER